MIKVIRKLKEIYKAEHLHFLSVDYSFYKRWKWIIRLVVVLNKRYVSCEIFRRKYKIYTNFVVIGLRWNGKNVKRRVNGYAKEYLESHPGLKCIYCNTKLTSENATADHIIPISKGGNNCQINIIICCEDCNRERGSLPFSEFIKIKKSKYLSKKRIFI